MTPKKCSVAPCGRRNRGPSEEIGIVRNFLFATDFSRWVWADGPSPSPSLPPEGRERGGSI